MDMVRVTLVNMLAAALELSFCSFSNEHGKSDTGQLDSVMLAAAVEHEFL